MTLYLNFKLWRSFVKLIPPLLLVGACSLKGAFPETSAKQILTEKAFAQHIVKLLEERRFDLLAAFVHPQKGLSIAPYSEVAPGVVVSANELGDMWLNNEIYYWGDYHGSGEPIDKRVREFFAEFFFDVNFSDAKNIGVNKVTGISSNLATVRDVFPGSPFVEFFQPGKDPSLNGLDWRSLFVVLEAKEDRGWWLIALVSDRWVI